MSGNEKQQNPTSHDSELAGIAGISVSEVVDGETIVELRAEDLPTRDLERVFRRRKQLAVQRHLRIAEQYIQNIIKGKFPKIDLRYGLISIIGKLKSIILLFHSTSLVKQVS